MANHEVQQLLDRQAIHDVLMRYARGVDRWDFDMVRDCYHPGATDDHGGFSGTVEDFIPWVQGQLERFESTMHFLGNVLIEFDDESVVGDETAVAWAETYCVAYHRLRKDEARGAGDADSIAGLRYVDRFERRDLGQGPEWRIAHRQIVVEWNRLDSVKALGFGPEYITGKRDGTDPVWRRGQDEN